MTNGSVAPAVHCDEIGRITGTGQKKIRNVERNNSSLHCYGAEIHPGHGYAARKDGVHCAGGAGCESDAGLIERHAGTCGRAGCGHGERESEAGRAGVGDLERFGDRRCDHHAKRNGGRVDREEGCHGRTGVQLAASERRDTGGVACFVHCDIFGSRIH